MVLSFIGDAVPLSSDELVEAARFICSGKPFQVRDIEGGLTDTRKLAFAQHLLSRGLLDICGGSELAVASPITF